MFRGKRYFTCAPGCGVFVGLDKLTPLEDSNVKSPPDSSKRDEYIGAYFTTRPTISYAFSKGKKDESPPRKKTDIVLKVDQRVVAFVEDVPARGSVRYIGEEKDSSGYVHTIVGLQLVGNCSFKIPTLVYIV